MKPLDSMTSLILEISRLLECAGRYSGVHSFLVSLLKNKCFPELGLVLILKVYKSKHSMRLPFRLA